MDNVLEMVKSHPIPILLAVVVVIVLIRSGGAGASSDAGAAASIAGVNAQSNVQISNINAGLQAARDSHQADIYIASIGASRDLAIADKSTMAGILTSVFNKSVMTTQINAQQKVAEDNLNASHDVAVRALQSTMDMHSADINATLTQQGRVLSFEQANLPTLLQHSANLATISANTAVSLSTISANNAQAIASISGANAQQLAAINTQAARTNADTNSTSSLFSGAASLLPLVLSFL